ncbi:UEV domain-containing protein [Stachybotrys elegans]|uniref:UEV domain-containing protein n=1 Tax=Stachybotrys elegans TaxID=80388 RepID=A0A8K0SNU9_9HYPO|nr:UEV domain-containing protein [Stachybotrys elegans]
MPVPQHILNWLYSVLTSEYHDVNRTYNDVAHALDRYPSLSPRTDVHTFPNGSSALLLHITGTLPVNFRGSVYRFPISVWVPYAYPREPPLVYVIPTQTMIVRPGQHVDPQGQVYHPYLVGWAEFWDKSTLQDFLGVLTDVFAKEPPVVSRQAARPPQSTPTQPQQTPPPLPPLPPEMASSPVSQARSPPVGAGPPPPPKPPKPHQADRADARIGSPASSSSGPPLPPLPGQASAGNRASRYDSAPPLPPQAAPSNRSPQGPPPPQQQYPQQHAQHQAQPFPPHQYRPPPPGSMPPGQHGMTGWNPAIPMPQHMQPQQQPKPAPPPPDLLDDPVASELPAASAVAAPPIPPNPEKDALLRQLAQTLAAMRQRSRQQNESSMAGLQAQRAAMQSVFPVLQSELGQLGHLSGILTSNTIILREALHKADAVIEGSGRHPTPDIDELLVAPTVVSNQLYMTVAEERALGDAIFMLGRAVERGRISPAVFAKLTRSLAREWYLKKALVRKIGEGMGLS